MKGMLVFIILVVAAAGNAAAQAPPHTYIGLFFDDARQQLCATGSVPYVVERWVWVKPGVGGFLTTNFNTTALDGVTAGSFVKNPGLDPTPLRCRVCPDIYGMFLSCQTDWVWLVHQTVYVDSPDPAIMSILPFPAEDDHISVWNCSNEEEEGIALSQLYINYPPESPVCGALAVQARSWGAIKSLYR